MKIEIVGGSGEGQRRKITAYDEATNIATVDEKWTTIPDDTSEYCISNPAPKLTASDYTRTDISTPGQKKVYQLLKRFIRFPLFIRQILNR